MNKDIFKAHQKVDKMVGVRLRDEDILQVDLISKKNQITKACVIRTIVHDWLKKEGYVK